VHCEQKHLQRLFETFPADNRIPQVVRQGIPDRLFPDFLSPVHSEKLNCCLQLSWVAVSTVHWDLTSSQASLHWNCPLTVKRCKTNCKRVTKKIRDRVAASRQKVETKTFQMLFKSFRYVRNCLYDYITTYIMLQVDVIESQFSVMLNKMQATRDYEAIRLAHDQFLSSLHSHCFMHIKPVCCHLMLRFLHIYTFSQPGRLSLSSFRGR